MPKPLLQLVAPRTEVGTVAKSPPPLRRPNAELRTREHLTPDEVERLIKAAGNNRWGHRDATMILIAYRHGLRAAELVDLRWDSVDFSHSRMHVSRVKEGSPSTHPLTGRELRALRRLQREQEPRRRICSPANVAHHSAPLAGASCWPAWVSLPVSITACTRTCCATLAASSWPMTASIPDRCRHTWATRTFRTPCAIPRWPRRGPSHRNCHRRRIWAEVGEYDRGHRARVLI